MWFEKSNGKVYKVGCDKVTWQGSLFMLQLWPSMEENHCHKDRKERIVSSSWWGVPSFVQNVR